MVLSSLKRVSFLSRFFSEQPSSQVVMFAGGGHHERAHPIQRIEQAQYLYVPEPNLIPVMVMYALNGWVYSAVNKIAETAASARLRVIQRGDMTSENEDHGILRLLGQYGKPNDNQDSFEFFEAHFANLDLAGNSFWWWGAGSDGLPGEVHCLDPTKIRIVPGRERAVAEYIYADHGVDIPMNPDEITHFKRFNPYNRYWGLSAIQAINTIARSDSYMARWNEQFFGEDTALPAGILVVPANTSNEERDRIERELNAKHGGKRRTMVARADPGGTAWLDAGLKPRDLDFEKGRILSRQSIYEALGLPLGMMSETSTEAHALVAQRQFFESVELRHIRTTRKLNSDGMDLWPAARRWACRFEDIKSRATDWRRESLKVSALSKIMTVDEIRARHFDLPPMPKEERDAEIQRETVGSSANGADESSTGSAGRGDREAAGSD